MRPHEQSFRGDCAKAISRPVRGLSRETLRRFLFRSKDVAEEFSNAAKKA
jgi:hypothetical protein